METHFGNSARGAMGWREGVGWWRGERILVEASPQKRFRQWLPNGQHCHMRLPVCVAVEVVVVVGVREREEVVV